MTVGIAVLTTVASSAPRLIPSRRPAVIACRRRRLIAKVPCASRIRSGYHARRCGRPRGTLLLFGQRNVQRPDLSVAECDVGQVRAIALFPDLYVMCAGTELHDERFSALRSLPRLAVDQHFRIGGLHTQRQ